MRTFRLDRIEKQPVILPETVVQKPENYSIAEYSRSVFRMFDTDLLVEVKLLCKASTMKALIDKFGMDVNTVTIDENHFTARVSVCISPTFFRWVFGFCGGIKILEPDDVVAEYHRMAGIALDMNEK